MKKIKMSEVTVGQLDAFKIALDTHTQRCGGNLVMETNLNPLTWLSLRKAILQVFPQEGYPTHAEAREIVGDENFISVSRMMEITGFDKMGVTDDRIVGFEKAVANIPFKEEKLRSLDCVLIPISAFSPEEITSYLCDGRIQPIHTDIRPELVSELVAEFSIRSYQAGWKLVKKDVCYLESRDFTAPEIFETGVVDAQTLLYILSCFKKEKNPFIVDSRPVTHSRRPVVYCPWANAHNTSQQRALEHVAEITFLRNGIMEIRNVNLTDAGTPIPVICFENQ